MFLSKARCKLVNAAKFLAFREDDPKHHVIETTAACELTLAGTVFWMLGMFAPVEFGFLYFGGFGAVVGVVVAVVLALEVPHIICDR